MLFVKKVRLLTSVILITDVAPDMVSRMCMSSVLSTSTVDANYDLLIFSSI